MKHLNYYVIDEGALTISFLIYIIFIYECSLLDNNR